MDGFNFLRLLTLPLLLCNGTGSSKFLHSELVPNGFFFSVYVCKKNIDFQKWRKLLVLVYLYNSYK